MQSDHQNLLDDKIKQLLKELGNAINESISGSDSVNEHIQKIRDEGYNLYVVLDATIGLGKQDDDESAMNVSPNEQVTISRKEIQFRINVNDIQISEIGFVGIAVALLGRNTAVGTFFAALLFGALINGTSTRNLAYWYKTHILRKMRIRCFCQE